MYLLFVFTLYGLIVFNYGTVARYRYPFIVLYVVGLAYELDKVKGYRFETILGNKNKTYKLSKGLK